MNAGDREQLATLLEAVLTGETASGNADADATRLAAILAGSEDARRYYARYMTVRALMIQGVAADATVAAPTPIVAAIGDHAHPTRTEDVDHSTINLIAAAEAKHIDALRRREAATANRWRVARFAAAAAVLLAGGVAFVLMKQAADPTSPGATVATIGRTIDPVWDGPAAARPAATALRAGGRIELAGGVIEVALGGGRGSLIVEGPASLSLDAPGAITLDRGSVFATVRGGELVVRMPGGVVTDLGTEFGVAVDEAGTDFASRVDVFVGSVRAEPPAGATSGSSAPLVLTVGEAATFSDAGDVAPDPDGANAQRYVRSIGAPPGSLDVADLIAGGDGTTKRRGRGIDPATGRAGALPPVGAVAGDHAYHRVRGFRALDGGFVPAGSNGRVQVDSRGRLFAFPPTADATTGHVRAGGPIPTAPGADPFATTLGTTDHAGPGHALIAAHSNVGVTIDLAALRRLHPGLDLKTFRATVGNTLAPAASAFGDRPRADAYVIVDGVARFRRDKFTPDAGPIDVAVDLLPTDRFLTLAVTDGGDGIAGDHVLWGDPVLTATPASPR